MVRYFSININYFNKKKIIFFNQYQFHYFLYFFLFFFKNFFFLTVKNLKKTISGSYVHKYVFYSKTLIIIVCILYFSFSFIQNTFTIIFFKFGWHSNFFQKWSQKYRCSRKLKMFKIFIPVQFYVKFLILYFKLLSYLFLAALKVIDQYI